MKTQESSYSFWIINILKGQSTNHLLILLTLSNWNLEPTTQDDYTHTPWKREGGRDGQVYYILKKKQG